MKAPYSRLNCPSWTFISYPSAMTLAIHHILLMNKAMLSAFLQENTATNSYVPSLFHVQGTEAEEDGG